jgi:hypothetical protein
VVLLFHVQVFAFLGLALPVLLLTTRAPEDRVALSPHPNPLPTGEGIFPTRRLALASVIPGAALFLIWVVGRLGEPTEIKFGAPWKAWGPLLSSQNLFFKSLEQNREEFFQVLANMLRNGADRYGLYAALAVGVVGVALGLIPQAREKAPSEGPVARFRLLFLGLIALGLYFLLPFDIRGYMYYLNTRFAHLAAPLLLCAVPNLRRELHPPLLLASTLPSLLVGLSLVAGFAAFNAEAAALDELATLSAARPMVMGLIFDTSSRVVRHPVFLHSAAVIARERGGATNFSFALTPHSPLRYRAEPPPTFPSEWRPDQFSYERQGRAYDHFLLRGINPTRVFGSLLENELYVAGQAGTFTLVRRR